MSKGMNLQDVFLNQARKDKVPLTIYLTNGFQFKGIIKGFDIMGACLTITSVFPIRTSI